MAPGIFKTFFLKIIFFPFQIKLLALLKKVQVRKSEEVQKIRKRVIATVIITIDIIDINHHGPGPGACHGFMQSV